MKYKAMQTKEFKVKQPKQKTKIVFKLNMETKLPQAFIDAVPFSGDAGPAVERLIQEYRIFVDPNHLRIYLKSTGAWSNTELQDFNVNLERLVWLATTDCQEEGTNYFYMECGEKDIGTV